MSAATDQEIAAATAYEQLYVAGLFGEWAPRVSDAARIGPGDRVLDVACGTGVLAREAAARVGPAGSVAGVDLAAGMVTVARRLAPALELRVGHAEALPWPDASFDAVVCQFGLMFFEDRARALREMARVLVPGGRVAVAAWASADTMPAYAAEIALFERLASAPAADALRAPFALGDAAAIARLLEDAGLVEVDVATRPGEARFASVEALVEGDLRGWLPIMGVTLPEPRIQAILAAAGDAIGGAVTRDGGTIRFPVRAHVATAVARPAA